MEKKKNVLQLKKKKNPNFKLFAEVLRKVLAKVCVCVDQYCLFEICGTSHKF